MIKSSNSPADLALVLICEKCGKKLAGGSDENPAQNLKALLKEKINATFGKGHARAVVSSCMDLCPKGEMTVAISWDQSAGGKNEFFTVEPGPMEEIADVLITKLKDR